jgi:hypothetical protein
MGNVAVENSGFRPNTLVPALVGSKPRLPLQKMRILIAEDNSINQQVALGHLRAWASRHSASLAVRKAESKWVSWRWPWRFSDTQDTGERFPARGVSRFASVTRLLNRPQRERLSLFKAGISVVKKAKLTVETST